jgi:predicted signal transduction protein with EAL and GGDEF domain
VNPLHLIQPSPGGTRPAGPSGVPVDRRSSGASAEDRLAHIGLHDPLTGLPNQCTIAQLITDIGAWVIEAICRQAVAWRAQRLAPRISFNAAPRELRDAGYVERLAAALARHALAPQQFMLEVTESALVGAKGALPTLDALHRLGVVLAIDDFGTQ